jgi:hypothetical protein
MTLKRFTSAALTLFMTLSMLLSALPVHADARDDFVDLLEFRQREVVEAFDRLDIRVKGMNSNDVKKSEALKLLNDAEDAVNDFKDLDADDHVEGPEDGPFEADDDFKEAETAATEAMNDVNRFLIAPFRPGTTDENPEGTVPEGDLIDDFIPQAVRLLFRFTFIAILISIIVSVVMLITSFNNEERQTKARDMLMFSLIGFAVVALAFALVTAITNIDFFSRS